MKFEEMRSTTLETILSHPAKDAKRRTEEFVEALNFLASSKIPEFKPLSVRWSCPDALEDHRISFRQFAHALHSDRHICAVPKIGELDDPYLAGILAHEFGHWIAYDLHDDATEEGADAASETYLGMSLSYETLFDLERATDADTASLRTLIDGPPA